MLKTLLSSLPGKVTMSALFSYAFYADAKLSRNEKIYLRQNDNFRS